MTQRRSGRDEDAPGGVTDTGEGTGGSLGTGTVGDRGAGAAEPSKGGQGSGAADKLVKGMSEAGQLPEEPLKK
jgi:hypothetical protein